MSTQSTTHPPSAIETLSGVLWLKTKYGDINQLPSLSEAQEDLANWVLIFRGRANLALALDALRATDRRLAGVCSRYLEVLGASNEDL